MSTQTFFSANDLETAFEFYEACQPLNPWKQEYDNTPSRCFHKGRVYGYGEYGDYRMEERYQEFIKNGDLVLKSLNEYREVIFNSVVDDFSFDDIIDRISHVCDDAADGAAQGAEYFGIRFEGEVETDDEDELYEIESDYGTELYEVESDDDGEPRVVMRIAARKEPLEEGEIEEGEVYPDDLINEEPFIRAPVISAEAAEIMKNEFENPYNYGYPKEEILR